MLSFILTAALAVDFNIAGGDADDRISQWSRAAHLNVLYEMEKVTGVVTQPVHGSFEPIEALRLMLKGTHLAADPVSASAVAVFNPHNYCRPELGASAPLPPCLPRPFCIIKERP